MKNSKDMSTHLEGTYYYGTSYEYDKVNISGRKLGEGILFHRGTGRIREDQDDVL